MNIAKLPEEILLKIFSCLSLKDLHWGVRQACKSWYDLTYQLPLWKKVDLDENRLSEKLGNESFLKLLESVAEQVEELKFGKLKFLSDEALLHEGIFCPNLRGLNFTETDISTSTVCKLLRKYPDTEQICIKNCESVNLLEILDSICNLSHLRKLTLGNSLKKYDRDRWNQKLQLLFKSSSNLQEVGFISRNVTDETIETLLRHCPLLENLSLANCSDISDEAFEEMLPCENLEFLNITSTGISDKGLQQIAKNCKNLKSIIMKRCLHATDVGFTHIATHCKQLEKLVINDIQFADGNITNVGIQQLAAGCPNLKVLQVNYCPGVNNQGIIALAEHCHHLQDIGVAGCMALTDEAVLSLAKNCSQLQFVNLTSCVQITAKSMNTLVLSCSKLHTLKLETCHSVSKLNFDKFYFMENPFSIYSNKENDTGFGVGSNRIHGGNVESACGVTIQKSASSESEEGKAEQEEELPVRKIINDPKLMINTTKDSYFVNDSKKNSTGEQILEITKELLGKRPSSSLSSSETDLTSNSTGSTEHLAFSLTSSNHNTQSNSNKEVNVSQDYRELPEGTVTHICNELFSDYLNIPLHSHLQVLHIGFCSKITDDAIKQIATHCPDLNDFSICACYQVTDTAIEFLAQKCKLLQILDISGGSPLESTKLTNKSLLALGKYGANIKELVILRNNLITPDGIREVLVKCTHLKSIWFLTGESTPVSLQAVLSIISILTNRVAKLRTYKVPVWSDFGGRRSRVKVELFDTAFMH